MTDQTIRERIRDVVSTSSIVDPHNIAAKLIESATASDRADWLAEVLPRYVGDVLRNDRNSLISESAIAPRPVRSAKVAGVRDWWHKFTTSTIAVDGTWKAMGELTADDLAVVVAERRDHAAATLRQADRFECLAGLLVTHGVGDRLRTAAHPGEGGADPHRANEVDLPALVLWRPEDGDQ